MRRQEISFIETKETRTLIIIKDQFEFRKDKKYHWLQNIMFKILVKLECYVQSESVSFKQHIINPNDFIEKLFSQHSELMSTYDQEGMFLLIGSEDYHEMTGNPKVKQMFQFETEYRKHREIYGMKIKVIPWMKGMLVVPKL